MSLMNIHRVVVGKGDQLVPAGTKEVFIIPSEFCSSAVADSLFLIRNNTHGYWFRMERLVSEFKEFVLNRETPLPFEMKYIVTKDGLGQDRIFIFSKTINHDCFSQVVNELIGDDMGLDTYMRVISAGFTDLKTCYGRSETLNLDSLSEDTDLLLHFLGKN